MLGGDLSYDSAAGQFSIDVETAYTTANFDADLANATTAGTLRFGDGSASAPSISNTGDTRYRFTFSFCRYNGIHCWWYFTIYYDRWSYCSGHR